jgi:nucleotidyltransferase/DNA polymerase involved in DNA repair
VAEVGLGNGTARDQILDPPGQPIRDTADLATLRAAVGSMTDWLLELASGRDDRAVEPNRAAKSSSSEGTYAQDLTDLDRGGRFEASCAHPARRSAEPSGRVSRPGRADA